MPSIGTVNADLILNSASFISNFQKAADATASNTKKINDQVTGMRAGFASAATAVKGFAATFVGSLATIATVKSLAALGQTAIDTADEIGSAATRIGVSAEELQSFRFAADQANVSTSELDSALKVFGKNLASGQLATSQTTITGALNEYVKRISDAPTFLAKATIATQAFGRQWQIGIALAAEGATAFADNAKNAFVISNELVGKADNLNDAFARVRESLAVGFATGFLTEFGKGIDANADALNNLFSIAQLVGAVLGEVPSLIAQTVQQAIGEIQAIGNVALSIVAYIQQLAQSVWQNLVSIANQATATIQGYVDKLKGYAAAVGQAIMGAVSSLASAVGNLWAAATASIQGQLQGQLQPLVNAWNTAWAGMANLVQNVVNAIERAVQKIKALTATVSGFWNSIPAWARTLITTAGVPGVGITQSLLGGMLRGGGGAGGGLPSPNLGAGGLGGLLGPGGLTLPKLTDVFSSVFGGGIGGTDSFLKSSKQQYDEFLANLGKVNNVLPKFGGAIDDAGANAAGAGGNLISLGQGALGAGAHLVRLGDGFLLVQGELESFNTTVSNVSHSVGSLGQIGASLGGFGNGLGVAGLGLNSVNTEFGKLIPTIGFTTSSIQGLGQAVDLSSVSLSADIAGNVAAFDKGFDWWESLTHAGTSLTQEFIRWQAGLLSRRVILTEEGTTAVAPAFGPDAQTDFTFSLLQRQKTQKLIQQQIAEAQQAKADALAAKEKKKAQKALDEAMAEQDALGITGGISAGKPVPSVHITLEGSTQLFTRDQVLGLIDQMGEALGDGAKISIS